MLQKTSTSIRLLELLVKILGSTEDARIALHCSEKEWDQWIHGSEEPPWTVFERMVDIVILYQSKEIQAHHQAVQKLRSALHPED
jgi:2-phospho-L-lactate transferase/gluconeogenesis factor (CofD/UPF0052 family)